MSEVAAEHVEVVEWRRKKTTTSARPESDAQTEFRGGYRLSSGAYRASIWDPSSRAQVWLGTFGTIEDAARACAAAVKLPGARRKKKNRAKFRGVYRRGSGSYGALIVHSKGKARRWLGTFGTAEEAARAYDAAAVELHGERAITNFGPGSVMLQGTQLSTAEWQQVDEVLKGMDSAHDREAMVEAAAILHQIALAGHGDGGRDEPTEMMIEAQRQTVYEHS